MVSRQTGEAVAVAGELPIVEQVAVGVGELSAGGFVGELEAAEALADVELVDVLGVVEGMSADEVVGRMVEELAVSPAICEVGQVEGKIYPS